MGDFVDVPVTVQASDFEDLATSYLQTVWPDWVGEDGDPEIINIESISTLAENLAQLLSNMPSAALITLGVKLLNIPYGSGQSAYTSVTMTVQDNAGYVIPAYSAIIIDGYGFVLTADVVIPAGSNQGVGVFASTQPYTSEANGLTGVSVTPLALPNFVTALNVLSPTTGGLDPQTDDDYVDQVSRDRRLNSRAIVTPLDFELAALDVQGITRAHTDVTATNSVTVTVLGVNGAAATSGAKAAVAGLFTTATKMVNVVVVINDPTFNTVSVTYQVQGESGFDQGALVASVNGALASELSPLTHGLPEAGDPGSAVTTWINDPYIYVNRMIQVIGKVTGVHRVVSISIGGSLQAKLSAALSTAGPITTLPLSTLGGSNLANTLPSGAVVTLNDGAGHTQDWTLTAQANPNAASLSVGSQTPNFAYPTTTTLSSNAVSGDYQMSGAVPVPLPGVFSGTAI